MTTSTDFKNDLKEILHQYLGHLSSAENKRNFLTEELEVRFTPYKKSFFSKADYDNVIARLMSSDVGGDGDTGTIRGEQLNTK